MTNRNLLDPNSLPAEPTPQELRLALVDLWEIAAPHLTSETLDYEVPTTYFYFILIMANTASKTVTLPASPKDGQQVYVVRANAAVTIDGNGKNICGSATVQILMQYDGYHLVFSEDDDEWYAM